MHRDGTVAYSMLPTKVALPAPVRIRDALAIGDSATDEDVISELSTLPRAAACDGCRHAPDTDSRGHFACSAYHPAWDIAEELGIADAVLTDTGWRWVIE
jgi:hypothetical protein